MPKGDTNPALQIHLLSALRGTTAGWTAEQKASLMDVYARAAQWRGGASFPGFINLLFEATIAGFSDEEKQMAYGKVPQFAPLTEAELAARRGVGRPRPATGATRASRAAAASAPSAARRRSTSRSSRRCGRPPSRPGAGRTTRRRARSATGSASVGTDFGPDLTTLASRFKKRDVVEAILWPSRAVSDQYQSVEVTTTDKQTLFGLVAREDAEQDRAADDAGRAADRDREGQGRGAQAVAGVADARRAGRRPEPERSSPTCSRSCWRRRRNRRRLRVSVED